MSTIRTLMRWAFIIITALLCFILLLGQILVPIAASDAAREYPEVQHVVAPYSLLGIATLCMFQIALILLCFILLRRTQDSFFTPATRRLILICGSLCTLGFIIPASTAFHLLATIHAGGPIVLLGMIASLLAAGAFVCITHISLKAFDSARAEHEELGDVI